MSKIKFEIDTAEILELIGVEDIIDTLASDIITGDSGWWASKICEPILDRLVKELKNKNSELFKAIVEEVSAKLISEIDVKPTWNRIVEERISKILKM